MTYIKVHHERLQQMKDALRESGWHRFGELGPYDHADYRDEHVQKAKAVSEDLLHRIDELIDVLGLRDEYPNETQEMFRPWNGGYYEIETIYGRTRFLADIHAAHEASEGAEALARIREALGWVAS